MNTGPGNGYATSVIFEFIRVVSRSLLMYELSDMHEKCRQCGFDYARIDTERWNNNTARRVMCPICGWTKLEEHQWNNGTSLLKKRNESYGFGAYRLVPPGGYSGYNAFHSIPAPEVIEQIKDLLGSKGWKGYLTLWDIASNRARLIAGTPLQKFDSTARNE